MNGVARGAEPRGYSGDAARVTPEQPDSKRVDADVLVLGSANMDVIMPVTALPKSGETVLGERRRAPSGRQGREPGGGGCARGRAGFDGRLRRRRRVRHRNT